MTTSITAAVATEFNQPLTMETLNLRKPGPGEIQVRMQAVAICHSDITYLDGGWGGDLPAVYGHEAAGVVEAVGPGVTRVEVGQRAIVTLIKSCGTCPTCHTGRPVYCANWTPAEPVLSRADGTPVLQGLKTGAFAERVVVDQSQAVPIADTLSADIACLLACGVPTGFGAAVNTARVRPGDNVVVIGAGGVGLNAVQGARIAGAARIVAVDLSQEKLNDAKEFGATDGVLASEAKPWRAAQAAMRGQMADHVFVTVGAIPAYQTATRYLAAGGTAYAVGMPHSGQTAEYEPVMLGYTGQALRGSLMGEVVLTRDIPYMIDLYEQGRLKLDELVTGRWKLSQINEAMDDTRAGKARRNVIVF
ncbi:MAG: Zn-dependent alcohol dehydrogenase [Pseudomonadota bacterium]